MTPTYQVHRRRRDETLVQVFSVDSPGEGLRVFAEHIQDSDSLELFEISYNGDFLVELLSIAEFRLVTQ